MKKSKLFAALTAAMLFAMMPCRQLLQKLLLKKLPPWKKLFPLPTI